MYQCIIIPLPFSHSLDYIDLWEHCIEHLINYRTNHSLVGEPGHRSLHYRLQKLSPLPGPPSIYIIWTELNLQKKIISHKNIFYVRPGSNRFSI